MQLFNDFSLSKLNTFGINVFAKYFTEFSSFEELVEVYQDPRFKSGNKIILGGGSNILFTKNYNGLVLRNNILGITVETVSNEEVIVTAGAGVGWHSLVQHCVENNYGGIENLSLIPGTVGAAPIQNIGAYGQELKDVFISLKGMIGETAEEVVFLKDDCRFGYRNSIFKNELKNKFVITSVSLKLSKIPKLILDYGDVRSETDKLKLSKITVRDVSKVICRIRERKLADPNVLGNAGSFFKNPEIDMDLFSGIRKKYEDVPGHATVNNIKISAGWLIEKAGWKGKRIGNVGTYANQALVIVNYGGASGKEVLVFAEKVKQAVYDKFNIWLEAEVNII